MRELFIKHIALDRGGVPLAMEHMFNKTLTEPEIKKSDVRQFQHDAGVKYFSMLPIFVILAAGFMAFRYIGRGIGSIELQVLAGGRGASGQAFRSFAKGTRKRQCGFVWLLEYKAALCTRFIGTPDVISLTR